MNVLIYSAPEILVAESFFIQSTVYPRPLLRRTTHHPALSDNPTMAKPGQRFTVYLQSSWQAIWSELEA